MTVTSENEDDRSQAVFVPKLKVYRSYQNFSFFTKFFLNVQIQTSIDYKLGDLHISEFKCEENGCYLTVWIIFCFCALLMYFSNTLVCKICNDTN